MLVEAHNKTPSPESTHRGFKNHGSNVENKKHEKAPKRSEEYNLNHTWPRSVSNWNGTGNTIECIPTIHFITTAPNLNGLKEGYLAATQINIKRYGKMKNYLWIVVSKIKKKNISKLNWNWWWIVDSLWESRTTKSVDTSRFCKAK